MGERNFPPSPSLCLTQKIETLLTAEQIIHTHSNTSTNITSNTASTSQATIAYTKPLPISRTRQRIGDSLSPIPELSDEEEFPPLPAPRKTTVLSLGQRTTLSEHITNYNKQQQTRTPLLPTPTQPQRPDQTPPSAHRLPVYKIPPRTQTRTGPIIPRPQPPGQTQLPPLAQLPPNPHFTSPITMETRQTPPGPQTSTPQTTRQLKMTDSTNHRRPELSPIKNTTTTTTSATTVTSPPNNRKILTQAQIHRPPDQLNTTPDLHSISLTTHSNSNVSILISELISPLCPSPAGGADSGAGATPQRAPPEQKEEGNNMMKGNCKAKHIGTKSHSEPSSQLSSGAPAVSRADPDLSPPTNREVNTTDPQLASPPRQRTLTPILPDTATDLKRKGNNCKDPPGQNITHPQAEQIIHTHSNTSTNITSNTASTSQATIAYTKPLPISRTRQRIGDSLSPIPELSDEEEFPPLPAPRKTTVLSLGQRTTLSEHITNYNKQQQTRTPLLPTPTQPQRPDQTPPSAHRLPVYKIPPRTQTRTGPIIPRPQPPGQTQLPPLAQLPPNPHFTSPITMETRQTPPGPQTSTPQTTRQLKMTDSTNHRRPELSPIKNTTTTTTSATTVTSPPNNRKILTQAQIHRPPDQLNTTPDLHSISLTTHSNSNVSILISELISPLCPSPAGGADSGAGATPQRAPPEQKEEGNNMMKGNCKAKHIGTKSHSEPSSQLSSGAPAVSRADPDLSPPTNREVNTTDPQLASPPRQRTLTPILPDTATDLKRKGNNCKDPPGQNITHPQAEQIIHTHSNTSTNITSNTASTSQATIAYTKPLPISRTRQRIGDSLSPIPELSDEEEFPPLPAPRKTTVLSLGQRTTLSEHITNYNKQQQTRTPLLPTPTQPQRPDQTPPSAHRLPVYKIPPRTQTRTGPIIPRPQPPGQTQLPPLAQLPPNPHFTSPITMETRQTPPGPQTSTPQTTRQLKMTDSTNHRRPELSPIKNTTTTTTSATTVTSPPNNRKILTQAQIHRPPDQLNTTPDLHSISLTTHSNSNVSILISELISPLCPSPAGGADSGAGATPQRAPPEQKEEGNNMMKGNCKAKHIGTKSHSEPSSQLSSGAPAVSRADPDLSPPTNREVNTTDPQLASPPRQRTLTPILPDGDADPRDTNQTKEDNQTRGTSRQTRRKTRDDSAQMELLEEIVDLSPEAGRTTVPSTRAVSTMTMTMTEDEDRGEPAEGIRRQEEEQEPAEGIRQQEKESSPQSFPSYSPKEQRHSRRAREPSPIEDDDYSLDLLLGEVFGTEIDQTPPLAPRKKMVTTTAQVHRNPTQEDLMDLEEPDSENWGTSATSTPQPHKFDGDADPRDTNQTKEDNQTRGTSRQTRRKTRDDSAQMELLEEIVDLSPEAGRTTVPSTRAVSTMTMTMTEDEDRGEPAEGIRRQEEEQEPAEGIRQQEKESSPQSFPSYSPKEQRHSRRAREPSPIEDDDYSLDLLLGEVFGTEIDQTPPLAPRKKMVTTTAQVHRNPTQEDLMDLEEPDSENWGTSATSTPQPHKFDGDADPRDTNQTKEDNQTRGTSRQTRRKTRDDSAQMELLEEIVDLSPEAGRTTVPSTRAVSTMTMTMTEDEDRGEPAEGIRRQEEEQEPAEGIRQQEKESSPQSFPSYSPKEQRHSRRAREPSPIEDDDYSLDLLLGEVFGTEIDQTPPLAPRKKMVTTTAQVHRNPTQEDLMDLEEPDSENWGTSATSTPQPHKFDGDADPRDTNQTKEDNQTRGTSRQTRRKTRDDSAQMELLEEIVDLSPEAGRTTVPSTRAVSTMTMTMTEDEDRGEPAEGIRRQEEEQEPAEGIRQQEKESSPQSFPSYSPKEQRHSRRAREPSPIEDDDYSLDLLLGEVFGTEIDQTPPLAPRKKMVTTTAQVHRNPTQEDLMDLEEPDSENWGTSATSTPQPHKFDGDADPRDTNQTKEDNQTRGTSRQTRRKTRDDSAQMELLEEIVDLSPEAGRTTVPSTRAVSTMTMTMTEDEDRGEPAEGIRRQEEEQEPAEGIRQQEKESSPQSFPSYSPKEQRHSRRAREPSPIEDDDYSLDLLLGEVFGTEIDQTPPLAPRKKMVTTTAQVHRNPTQEDLMDLEEPDSENWGTSATSTPQPHKFGDTLTNDLGSSDRARRRDHNGTPRVALRRCESAQFPP
ncbi:hypothetical protein PAMA_006576 [Pampus argenteus]